MSVPSLPDAVDVQWNPTAAWNAELGDGDWTTIGLEIVRLWYKRGYERAQQRVEAGEIECLFKDPGRTHDPTKAGSATIGKGRRQIRVRVTVGATTYTVFRGLTEGSGWHPTWGLGTFHVKMTGTDRSPALEGMFLESVFRTVAKSLDPLWWFTLDEQGGSSFYNRGSDGATPSALVTNADQNGQPVLPYDKAPSTSFGADPGGSGFAGSGLHIQPPFTLSAVFATETTGALYSQNDGTDNVSDIIFAVDWGGALGTLTLFVDDPTNPSLQINTDQTVSDRAPHIGTVSYDDGDGVLRAKLDAHATKVGPLVAPPVPSPRFTASMIGNTRDGAQPFTGRMQHFMAWDRKLTPTEETDLHAAALTSWAGLRSDEQIANILDAAGIPAAERNLETGLETMGAAMLNASALTCLFRPANTEGGLFLFDREGKAAFYARDHVGSSGATRDTQGGQPGNTNIGITELEIDMDVRGYYTVGRARVSTPNPVIVEFRHANADVDGEIPWEPETEYEDEGAALAGATRAVGSGVPVPHYTGAKTIGKASNFVELITRDVWDTLDIVAHPDGDTETQPSRILMVEHELDGRALTWTCTLTTEAI